MPIMTDTLFDLPLDLPNGKIMELNQYQSPSKTSSYWRVPDKQQYLTALTVDPVDNLCAVASGAQENNLFVYEFDPLQPEPALTHHQTISLPFIHSMQWVPSTTGIGSNGNVLVSGHRNGLIHMTMLPDTYSSDTPAEILTRFNHLHHIGSSTASTRIKQLELVIEGGSVNYIGSICADHVFLWDPSRWDIPKLKVKSKGINCFDMCPLRTSIAAFGGRKGISIADFRKPSSTLSPPEGNFNPVTQVKWSPHDENLVAAVDDQHVVKIWDIRYSKPQSVYDGHIDLVTAVEWSKEHRTELVSASHDGSIRIWDMHDQKQALSSMRPAPVSTSRKWAQTDAWKRFQDRQSGIIDLNGLFEGSLSSTKPVISQTNRQFIDLKLVDHGAYTIDSACCFGYHKIKTRPDSFLTSASDSSSENDFSPPSPL